MCTPVRFVLVALAAFAVVAFVAACDPASGGDREPSEPGVVRGPGSGEPVGGQARGGAEPGDGEREPASTPVDPELLARAEAVSRDDVVAVAAANNAFGFEVLDLLDDDGTNVCVSPHSIAAALAMTSGGARGATLEAMRGTLHTSLAADSVHPATFALDIALRNSAADPDAKVTLAIANRVYVNGQFRERLRPPFVASLDRWYGAGLALADFADAPGDAANEINAWVDETTRGAIPEIVSADALTPATMLVLLNAVYFLGDWAEPFEESSTVPDTFTLADGNTVQPPMMRQTLDEARYTEAGGYQAVSLPYEGGDFAMWIVLPPTTADPKTGGAPGFDAATFDTIAGALGPRKVDLTLPRFTFEWNASLVEPLRTRGMGIAFDRTAADFGDIAELRPEERLFVADVLHRTRIEVNEAGTEAAAATAVIMAVQVESVEAAPAVMRVDRPFYFVLLHRPTRAVLFTGKVENPLSG